MEITIIPKEYLPTPTEKDVKNLVDKDEHKELSKSKLSKEHYSEKYPLEEHSQEEIIEKEIGDAIKNDEETIIFYLEAEKSKLKSSEDAENIFKKWLANRNQKMAKSLETSKGSLVANIRSYRKDCSNNLYTYIEWLESSTESALYEETIIRVAEAQAITAVISTQLLINKKRKGSKNKEANGSDIYKLAEENRKVVTHLLSKTDEDASDLFFERVNKYLPDSYLFQEVFENWKNGMRAEIEVARIIRGIEYSPTELAVENGIEDIEKYKYKCEPSTVNDDIRNGFDLTLTSVEGLEIPIDVKTSQGNTHTFALKKKPGSSELKSYNGESEIAFDPESCGIPPSLVEYTRKISGLSLSVRINTDAVRENAHDDRAIAVAHINNVLRLLKDEEK